MLKEVGARDDFSSDLSPSQICTWLSYKDNIMIKSLKHQYVWVFLDRGKIYPQFLPNITLSQQSMNIKRPTIQISKIITLQIFKCNENYPTILTKF